MTAWDELHSNCRNRQWLECRDDADCVWIKKVVEEIPADDEEHSVDNINFSYSADEDDGCNDVEGRKSKRKNIQTGYAEDYNNNEAKQMIIDSSHRFEANHVQMFAFGVVAMSLIIAMLLRFCHKRRKEVTYLSLNGIEVSNYSTF